MSRPTSPPAPLTGSILAVRIALVAGVCVAIGVLPYLFTGETTQIISYTAPKEPARNAPPEPLPMGKPGRLWGAIVPLKSDLWFFKITGPSADVARREADLRDFVQTVSFPNGEPKWTLPADWTERPGNEFRFVTIVLPAEKAPLELTVSRLGRGDNPLDEQLLANVNRWRGQVSLPPITLEELASSTERLEVAGVEATIVSLDGVLKPNSMGRGPFMQ
jgi:hypothetical protein